MNPPTPGDEDARVRALTALARMEKMARFLGGTPSDAMPTFSEDIEAIRAALSPTAPAEPAKLIPGYNRCNYCGSEWVTHPGEFSSHSCPHTTAARKRLEKENARAAPPLARPRAPRLPLVFATPFPSSEDRET